MEILSLGEKIKKLRKEKNMTLKELAGDRITAAQISHIERDKSHTSYDLLEYLSDKLGVSVEYLLENKEMQSKKLTDNLILKIEIYINKGKLAEAEETIGKTLDICKKYDLVENYGRCSFLLANIRLKQEQYDLAVVNFEKALYFFIRKNDKINIFNCYLNIGMVYMKQNLYGVAITHFNFAEELIAENKFDDYNTYKDLYSKMAICYIKTNKPNKSLFYVDKVNELDCRNGVDSEVDLLVLKANNLFKLGKLEESKILFNKALKLLEGDNDKNILADVYLNISDVYTHLGNVDKVIEYSQRAYDIKTDSGGDHMMEGLFKIISAYIQKSDYTLAKKYCKIALAASIKNKDKISEYKVLKKYSDICREQGESNLSVEYLTKSIDIVSSLGDRKVLAGMYIDMGKIYSNISKDRELEYYQKGLDMYKDLEII
ncbi:helix-turn-helix transcriptional regulator [Metaclostridioides mangenotii]|uniref:helix-turn-helix transcriptional regulator n=1 Tax=Metaclostridioides mangenotii TaxID=1540 RepID=UPI0028E4977C|nr:helix-turn-helix transcriptional regulator [Clostridioides mangenotii]